MAAGVITLGRRDYAVGLYWENTSDKHVSQAAKEAARQPGLQADFYAVRPGTKAGRVHQFGLGQLSAGHKAGMPVFAACLANQQGGSWAGAFRLRDGIFVVIVRDDLIVPDGDLFFTDENEARERLLQEIEFGGLQRIFAPEAWAIPGADTMPVSLLLNDRKDIQLRPTTVSTKNLMAGAVVATVLVLVLVAGWYYQEQMELNKAREAAQMAAAERARKQAESLLPGALQKHIVVYPPPERKWEAKPQPLALIDSCREGLGQITAAVAGWKLTQVRCDGVSLTFGLTHGKGYASPPVFAPPAKVTINDTGTTATVSLDLKTTSLRGHEDLLSSDDVMRRYLTQNWPGTINKAPDDPIPRPPDATEEWNPPPAPWVKSSFTVTVPELPATLPALFGDLPGLIINSLVYAPTSDIGGMWTIEGVIYENRS